jgi:hypothetical protein
VAWTVKRVARSVLHLIRLGTHAEQEYVLRGRPFFDALLLNANLVEATKSAISVLVTRLQKPYYIDPVTYGYGLDPRLLLSRGAPGSGKAKRTFVALASAFGLDPVFVGAHPLEPAFFDDPSALRDFVSNVLEYQRTVLTTALSEDAAFITSDIADRVALIRPQSTIAPYFVDDFSSAWRTTNRRILEVAETLRPTGYGSTIAIDSRGLGPQNLVEVASAYSEGSADTTFLWLADFDEHSAHTTMLRAYASLVELLANQGKNVIGSYGGFFSLLLAFRGLAGSCHGIGYGDKRDVEPVVGGGLPPARYYLPPVRDSIALGDLPLVALDLSPEEFRARVCGCTICDGLLSQGGVEHLINQFTETEDRVSVTGRVVAVPTARVFRMSRFHFMEARAEEFELVRQATSLDDVLAVVTEGAQWARGRLGPSSVTHVARWVEALQAAD